MLHVADAAGLARIESSIFSEDSRYDTVHSMASHLNSNIHEYFNTVEAGQVPFVPIANSAFISTSRNAGGETLLILAARCGHANVVEYFLKEQIFGDADLEESDHDGWTALLNAAHEGHAKVAHLLLEAGASVDQSDLMGWTPLMWATYKNHLEVVEVLVDNKAHINIVGEEDGLTPLIIAAGRGYTQIVNKLVSCGAQVNSSDKFGSTALIWAARKAREGYTEIAQALISASAFVNTVDRFGNSILASAVRSGNLTLVRMLLEKHADVNAKDSENRTPPLGHRQVIHRHCACPAGKETQFGAEKTRMERLLCGTGFSENRDVSLVQLLVNMGAKISATDVSGDNALHLADSKLLYRPNKLGETPYSIDQRERSSHSSHHIRPIGTDIDLKNLLGYDAYSDVLADVVCEPNLSLPSPSACIPIGGRHRVILVLDSGVYAATCLCVCFIGHSCGWLVDYQRISEFGVSTSYW
uniref:Uncharacterized protein n=1 Tax=Ditylenchus dipsaci TaxID=166011 RepID=A0A915EDN1_9BILA